MRDSDQDNTRAAQNKSPGSSGSKASTGVNCAAAE